MTGELYQDWVTASRRAADMEAERDTWRERCRVAEAERDAESVSRQEWADRAYRAQTKLAQQVERIARVREITFQGGQDGDSVRRQLIAYLDGEVPDVDN